MPGLLLCGCGELLVHVSLLIISLPGFIDRLPESLGLYSTFSVCHRHRPSVVAALVEAFWHCVFTDWNTDTIIC